MVYRPAMLFSGVSLFLSPKLSIPETTRLREEIQSNGGQEVRKATESNAIIVVETWDYVRVA